MEKFANLFKMWFPHVYILQRWLLGIDVKKEMDDSVKTCFFQLWALLAAEGWWVGGSKKGNLEKIKMNIPNFPTGSTFSRAPPATISIENRQII